MEKRQRQNRFGELRQRHPVMVYEDYQIVFSQDAIQFRYTFTLEPGIVFRPWIRIPLMPWFDSGNLSEENLGAVAFYTGMVELLSYWKCACPPRVIVKPHAIGRDETEWFQKLYYRGLGEFFYLNSIQTGFDDFMQIASAGSKPLPAASNSLKGGYLVPVGGGKDSVVTLELLGSLERVTPFVINQREATRACIEAAGYAPGETIEVGRYIDPVLLELNSQDYLNGHTPFSALLAFVSSAAAILSGRRNIALSNEWSANEDTIPGSGINHQYSKSVEFERDFRNFSIRYIHPDLNYFSFLRPLSELQIAGIFSLFPKYSGVFRSCNSGSKTGSWCGICPKCLFVNIILLPFLENEQRIGIFGGEVLENRSLWPLMRELCGISDVKPFECVGTLREVNLALCRFISRSGSNLPPLVKMYSETAEYLRWKDIPFEPGLRQLADEHFLNPEEFAIIKKYTECLTGY